MVTLKKAKNLKPGQIIYHKNFKNADGTAMRFKVNGKPKTWKRSPKKVKVPLKRGMYEFGYLDEYNKLQFTLNEPKQKKRSKVKSKR